jgi:hypothetical protein
MYVQLAPITLKPGISEAQLLEASDAFDDRFVKKQDGIVRRILLKAKNGFYADLVFFESKQAADRVLENEMNSPDCAAFFSLMEMPDESVEDMGVQSFEHVKTYE